MGPFPGLAPEGDPEEELNLSDSGEPDMEVSGSDNDLVFEEGDRLFYMKMPMGAEFIRTMQMMSYRLAVAAQKNLKCMSKFPSISGNLRRCSPKTHSTCFQSARCGTMPSS